MTIDEETPNDFAALVAIGEQAADVGTRTELINHPEDDGVSVLVSRERTNEGADRVVLAKEIMEALDARLPAPRRRIGTTVLTEVESLIVYVCRYKSEDTLVYAQPDAFRIEAVFDDHPHGPDESDAAWRKHRAQYTCPRSAEWKAWTELDGRQRSQEEFGDFIEQRLEDLRSAEGFPKPLEVLAMARHLVVHQKGAFERKIDPSTGNGILINKVENIPADSTVIPRAFKIGIPVFENGQLYGVEVRIRFAIIDGRAQFTYVMHRRREIERDAFNDVRSLVASSTALTVLAGQP